jgi:hypothetical protein
VHAPNGINMHSIKAHLPIFFINLQIANEDSAKLFISTTINGF